MENLVARARAAGCTALVLTVDVPLNSNRLRDLRNGMSIPPRLSLRNAYEAARRPRWLRSMIQAPPIGFRNFEGIAQGSNARSHTEFINTELANLAATWDDLAWLRRVWEGPIYIKGITTPADATRAIDAGVDGIIVSNHGGRQLDGLPSAISAFPRPADIAAGRVELFVDGGIRSGLDVAKCLAMGASAVTLGRSWVYGVAAGGERGVDRVIEIYREELAKTLALVGANRADDLDASFVTVPQQWRTPRPEQIGERV